MQVSRQQWNVVASCVTPIFKQRYYAPTGYVWIIHNILLLKTGFSLRVVLLETADSNHVICGSHRSQECMRWSLSLYDLPAASNTTWRLVLAALNWNAACVCCRSPWHLLIPPEPTSSSATLYWQMSIFGLTLQVTAFQTDFKLKAQAHKATPEDTVVHVKLLSLLLWKPGSHVILKHIEWSGSLTCTVPFKLEPLVHKEEWRNSENLFHWLVSHCDELLRTCKQTRSATACRYYLLCLFYPVLLLNVLFSHANYGGQPC